MSVIRSIKVDSNWDYIAVLDFEANCVPKPKRDRSWKGKFDPSDFPNFKNEIIEIPTVVMGRRRILEESNSAIVKSNEHAEEHPISSETKNSNCNVERMNSDDDSDRDATSEVARSGPLLNEDVGKPDDDKILSQEEQQQKIREGYQRCLVAASDRSLNEDYVVIDEFRSFVKPVFFPVTEFCTHLTGITQEHVETAPLGGRTYPEVWRDWLKFMSQYPNSLLVTCGDWDLRQMLPTQLKYSDLSYPKGKLLSYWCNIKHCYKDQYGKKAYGMADMLESLDLSLEGRHHSGIDDCRNIAKIARKMLADGKKMGLDEQDVIYATSAKSKI